MRIGILTFPNSSSFGATLQMYALYQALKGYGQSVEVINYHNPYMKAEKHVKKSTGSINNNLALKKILHFRQILGFRKFEKLMQLYPSRPICDAQLLKQLGVRYDAVICGSDQVWNPRITDFDLSFYLDFCGENTKRISYAPSFGNTEYSEQYKEEIQKEIKQFSSVSVREEEGQSFLHRLMGEYYPVVLDPTFLLSEKEWIDLEKKYKVPSVGYILCYTVRPSSKLLEFCKKMAREQNKKVVIVGGNIIKKRLNKDEQVIYACDIDPREWLYLMHHSDCIVTNSFHGIAFSMHYRKNFYVELSSDTNSRMEEILCITGLEDRVIDYNVMASKGQIDYEQVYRKLEVPRSCSQKFLKTAIMK